MVYIYSSHSKHNPYVRATCVPAILSTFPALLMNMTRLRRNAAWYQCRCMQTGLWLAGSDGEDVGCDGLSGTSSVYRVDMGGRDLVGRE